MKKDLDALLHGLRSIHEDFNFKTVRKIGYEAEGFTSPYQKITLFGLLLIE